MPKTGGCSLCRSLRTNLAGFGRAALLCSAAVAQGCLFMPREAGERMQAELLTLRGDVQKLRADAARDEAHRQEHDQAADAQLAALQKRMDASSQSTHLAEADLGSQLERLVQELQQLRGAVEDNAHQLGETEGKLEQKLGERLAALQAANERREKAAAKAARPTGKKELLAYGRRALRSGRGEEGREVLRDLTKRFAKERGIGDEALLTLAGDAQAQGRFDAALRDYVRLLDTFAGGKHSDEAYFRVAECSSALGRADDARTFYNEVVAGYPRTNWAKLARQKLAVMGPAGAKGATAAGPSNAAPADANGKAADADANRRAGNQDATATPAGVPSATGAKAAPGAKPEPAAPDAKPEAPAAKGSNANP